KSVLDIQGNLLELIDADERTCMSYTYGMLGQVLKQTSIDAGSRWLFATAAGEPVKTWGERGFTQRFVYDTLRRLTDVWMGDGSPERQVEKLEYGEGHPGESAGNLRGRLAAHYDQAGVVRTESYDFKGNLLTQERQLASDYKSVLDWSGSPSLETETFTQTLAYDALNRPTSITTPDDSEILPAYNEAGLLESVSAKLRGASTATDFVTDIDYDEKGRRTSIRFDSGTVTTYTYHKLTYRLERLKTTRGSDLLQSLRYTYDPVGNVVETRDSATHSVYFSATTVPSADAGFIYDAIYRLIEATGREHAAGTSSQLDAADYEPPHNVPHPNDPSGLRRYTRTYQYDAV